MPKMSNRTDEICSLARSPSSVNVADRTLRTFRYVVTSVNDDALKAWSDLWEQLRSGVTPAGATLPNLPQGFTPPCGWPQFLETFWLLKHYLDYIHRFCEDSVLPPQGEENDDPSSI
jgi:hypothetical protein